MDVKIDHTEKTKLLIYELQKFEKLNNFVKSFLAESTETEGLLQDLLNDRNLEDAVGVQLDQVGILVGETRDNLDDETFRRNIRLRIAVNTSEGTIEDVYKVISLLYGDVDASVFRNGKAQISIFLGIEQPEEDLIPLLQQTIPAGVSIETIVYSNNRLPWIPTERGGVIQDTGVLPERDDESPLNRVPPERINV